MSKFIYTIEGAEKITTQSGQLESGDSILYGNAKTESQAKKIGMKFLSDNRIFSVWIHKYKLNDSGEISDDPYYQWNRYKNDSDWSKTNGWKHFD